jgi:hypothetical protein
MGDVLCRFRCEFESEFHRKILYPIFDSFEKNELLTVKKS